MQNNNKTNEIRESRFNVSIDYLKSAVDIHKGIVQAISENQWEQAYQLTRTLHIVIYSRMRNPNTSMELKEKAHKMYIQAKGTNKDPQANLRFQDAIIDWYQEIIIQADYAGLFLEDKPSEWDAIGK